MTRGQRVYYLALAAFCCSLCVRIQMETDTFSSRWWVCFFGFVYAVQPFINLARAGIRHLWPKRATLDRYQLIKNARL